MKHGVGLAIALLVMVAASVPVFAQGPLSDVPTDHWAYQALDKLAQDGIIEGYPDGTFKGNRSMTRYEFAVAIARIKEYGDANWGGGAGVPGPQGEMGPMGPAGPAGPAGATGDALTAEQKQLLDQLKMEFMPELKELSVMVENLEGRVEDLEAREIDMPRITVSGGLSYRVGVYGTELKFHGETTGYPLQPFPGQVTMRVEGGLGDDDDDDEVTFDVPYEASGAVADSKKDSYKAGGFSTLLTKVNFTGNINPDVAVKVSMIAEPRTNYAYTDELADWPSPNYWLYGVMDHVRVDEAWVTFPTTFIMPSEWTWGKQYHSVGAGLLFNNDQFAMKGVKKASSLGRNLSLVCFGGQLDREAFGFQSAPGPPFPGDEISGQDTYWLSSLKGSFGSWNVGGNWLGDGFGDEKGWSVDVSGSLFGLPIMGEYAQMLRNVADWKLGDWSDSDALGVEENAAWVVGMTPLNTSSVELSGKYGQVDPLYAFCFDGPGWVPGFAPTWADAQICNLPLSLLHPDAKVSPHDINWVDRPLFLDPTNVMRGWEVGLTLKSALGADSPVKVRYYDGDAYTGEYLVWLYTGGENSMFSKPAKWRKADRVWTVSATKPLAENVNFTLLYGRRQVANVMVPDLVGQDDDYLQDDIQVIRGELAVAF